MDGTNTISLGERYRNFTNRIPTWVRLFRGLLLIICTYFSMFLIPRGLYGGSFGGALVCVLIILVLIIYGIRLTIRDIRTAFRNRQGRMFNENFEMAFQMVMKEVNSEPNYNEWSRPYRLMIWDEWAHNVRRSFGSYLNCKKMKIWQASHGSVPKVSQICQWLKWEISNANTLIIWEGDSTLSINGCSPIGPQDIVEVNLDTRSILNGGVAHTSASYASRGNAWNPVFSSRSSRATSRGASHSVTTIGDITEKKEYSVMLSVNNLACPLYTLNCGCNQQLAYEVYSLLQALKIRS